MVLSSSSLSPINLLIQMLPAEEEELPEREYYKVEKQDAPKGITSALITRTSLDSDKMSQTSEEDKVKMLLELRTIHLQWQGIQVIENLEVYSKVAILYLQHNQIKKIDGLETLTGLEYLSLNNNEIEVVEGISRLTKLEGLNLSNNKIESISGKQFPPNLQLLSLKENPVAYMGNYKELIVKCITNIDVLDGDKLDTETKFKLLGIFPSKLSKYSEAMKKFREGKEKKEEDVFKGSALVDEDQILKEMREKTEKILASSRESSKEMQKDQLSNFEGKIKVSKNIRKIVEKNNTKTIQEEPEQDD